jgi:hypothetical protein
MGILNVAIFLLGLVVIRLIGKVIWKSGFLAGKDHEAMMWLASIDKLMPPNWQSLVIGRDDGLTPEQLEMANRVYAAAYRTALDHIKLDIGLIRRKAIEEFQAKQELPGFQNE